MYDVPSKSIKIGIQQVIMNPQAVFQEVFKLITTPAFADNSYTRLPWLPVYLPMLVEL